MKPFLDFLLYDWLDIAALCQRPRHNEHSRETFESVFELCQRVAQDRFAPFNRVIDVEEPHFDGEKVILPQATYDATHAYVETGLLAAPQDYEAGGMQLPYTVERAANMYFSVASVGLTSYPMIASSNANLLMEHGSAAQKQAFCASIYAGRALGTMALSEPQAGSSLSDIVTRATPDGQDAGNDPLGPRFRLRGNKMWISAGEHNISENIIHLVLAKIPGPDGTLPDGVKGISLFIVPRMLVNQDGSLTGERNDIALAGLNHKLGNRGVLNTLLNFGEGRFPAAGPAATDGLDGKGAGAIGYLIGEPGRGLHYMFHMMNEMRILVGMTGISLGFAGYQASLDYARQRPQGRRLGVGGKDPSKPQVPIIEHGDVKRMLLAQKAYNEGSLGLALYCSRLVDDQRTGSAAEKAEATLMLEMLTPIVKSWPSEWCLEANSLAMQIHGGYGYTRDFPVEMYWRENRLNMIHEGTHGIQAIDLLHRKVRLNDGAGLALLASKMRATAQRAHALPALRDYAAQLEAALDELLQATDAAWSGSNLDVMLSNAVPYMQAFGHTVIAWIWLDMAIATAAIRDEAQRAGHLAALRYFFHYELPKNGAWLQVAANRDDTCMSMQDAWF